MDYGRKWSRKFQNGRTDVRNKDGQGRQALVTENLVDQVDEIISEHRRFNF